MCNKHKILAVALIAAAFGMGSCSGDSSRSEIADSLIATARQQMDARDYQGVVSTLDSLDRSYRECVAQRRAGTRMRLEALQSIAYDSLAINEVDFVKTQATSDSLKSQFKFVGIAGTDGYYVDKSVYTGREMAATSVQPRVDDKGYFFIAVNLNGKKIGLNGLSYGSVSTRTGDQSLAVESSEIMTLSQENVADLVAALGSATAPAKLILNGSKGKAAVTLDGKQLQAFVRTWQYAMAVQQHKSAEARREHLQNQITHLQEKLSQLPDSIQ